MLAVLGVFLVEPCVASVSIPEHPKSGPEIASVTIYNTPIWKSPVTSTNPYTGEVTGSASGYWIQNGTIEIAIKNRPFTLYSDENSNTINTYYCLFYKGTQYNYGWIGSGSRGVPIAVYQSDSTYTVIPFTYGDSSQLGFVGGDISFRVQAVEGGYFRYHGFYTGSEDVFEGVGSEWTEFTITMPTGDTASTLKPDIKPTSVAPSSSNPNILPTSDPYYPPSQNSWQSSITISIATTCIITIPLVITAYYYGKRKTKPVCATGDVSCEVKTQ